MWSAEASFVSAQTEATEVNIIAFGDLGVADCDGTTGWCMHHAAYTVTAMEKRDERKFF